MTVTVLIILLATLAAVRFVYIYVKRRKSKRLGRTPYLDALHLLIEGNKEEALEQLKRTVREDTDNIMAYVILGDIFRDNGFPIRAAKIHRNLLVRGDLTEAQIEIVLYHLVLDYRTTNMLDKAIEMAERLIHRNKKNLEYKKLLLSFYEEKGDWDKAFFYRQSANKWFKMQDQDILALYKVQSGLDFTKKGAEREGRIRFREAIKFDKKCIPAYLYWGDSYRREGRNEDASKVWHDFTVKNPEFAFLAFNRLKDVLYDLGRYSEIEGIYQEIIQKKPKDPTVYLNLAELYKKQDKMDQAIELCRTVLDTHPESPRARHLLVQFLHQKGDDALALEEALQILNREMVKQLSFRCSHCGTESQEPLWHCPQCHRWKTFLIENP